MTPRTIHVARLAVLLVTVSLSATTLLWIILAVKELFT